MDILRAELPLLSVIAVKVYGYSMPLLGSMLLLLQSFSNIKMQQSVITTAVSCCSMILVLPLAIAVSYQCSAANHSLLLVSAPAIVVCSCTLLATALCRLDPHALVRCINILRTEWQTLIYLKQ